MGLVVIQPRPLDQNPAAVYLASLAATGRKSMLLGLRVMAELLTGNRDALAVDWSQVRYQHAAALRAKLIEHYAPASVNLFLSALKGTLKEAWRLGLMSAEDYARATDLKNVPGQNIPAGRELASEEVAALMTDCENDPGLPGIRDAAIISLMYTCGLRRAEVITLDLDDYDPESGRLAILGKRMKERTGYLNQGAADAMADWLAVRGAEPGPLFLAIRRGRSTHTQGVLTAGRRMTDQAVYHILANRAKRAGVFHFSPHDMRRTFVSDLLDAGADIATVSKMAGHANVQTTARYDRRGEAAKQKAATLLTIPYLKRSRQ
jgi:site-specific recombinase XerD